MIKAKYSVEWVSVVTLFYAILFLFFADRLSRQGEGSRRVLVVMLLKSTLFLILTIPLLFSRHWITIFWTLLSALLLMGGKKLAHKNFVYCALGLYFAVLLKFLFYDLSFIFQYNMEPLALYMERPYGYLIFERWATMALILAAPYFMRRLALEEKRLNAPVFTSPSIAQLPPVFLGLFGMILFSRAYARNLCSLL